MIHETTRNIEAYIHEIAQVFIMDLGVVGSCIHLQR